MADVTFTSHKEEAMKAVSETMSRALEICGGKAETYAKQLAPFGTPESTGIPGYHGGTLRNSITHEQWDEKTEVIGSAVKYAPYVEFGTYKMKARPFMRPAAENHRQEYSQVIERELAKINEMK